MKTNNFILLTIITVAIVLGILFYQTSINSQSMNLDMNRQIGVVEISLRSPMMCSSNTPITIIEYGFLYSNQLTIDNGWANINSQKRYVYNRELGMDLFVSCIDSGKYEKHVLFNTKESQKNEVKGTPTFFIIGPQGQQENIIGPQPYQVFEKVIDSLL